MAKVRVAPHAGFCFGVQRAVEMAETAVKDGPGPVYTLGPIIHNPLVVDDLRKKGLLMAQTVQDVEGGTVIIRSHGAPEGVIKEAENMGLHVVDATCPLVNRLRDRVVELAGDGYKVVIVGDEDHPEVEAILSFAEEQCIVVKNSKELPGSNELSGRVGLVAQTTQSLANLQEVAAALVGQCVEVKVFQTTCHSTNARSVEARQMANEVDIMMVVGGRNSSNTRRLAEAAREEGARTYHIESADELGDLELPSDAFFGVTAGASTPAWVISEVVAALEKL